jgi:hypothetical protein
VGRPVLQSSTESAEGEQSFGSAVKGHSHAVQKIDDRRSPLGHTHDRRLVVQEVSTRDRVFEVKVGRVSLAPQVHRSVDATLGTDAMAALYGDNAKELDIHTCFRKFESGHEARKASTHDDHISWRGHSF